MPPYGQGRGNQGTLAQGTAAAHKVLELRDQIHALRSGEALPADAPEAEGDTAPAAEAAPAASLEELQAQLDTAAKELAELQGDTPMVQIEVNPDLVGQVVSDWTGIPLGKVARDESAVLLNLSEHLKERIKGQDQALDGITEVIKAAKTGIKNPNSPWASSAGRAERRGQNRNRPFAGRPDFRRRTQHRHHQHERIQESHTVSRLIGSPPDTWDTAKAACSPKPYARIPTRWCSWMKWKRPTFPSWSCSTRYSTRACSPMVKARKSTSEHHHHPYKQPATDVIQEMTNMEEAPPIDAVTSAIRPLLSEHFKPALLARMSVLPFYSLRGDAMRGIVGLKLNKLKNMLRDNNKMALTWTEKVVDQITERCTEVETGARNIEYIINGNVLPQLSQTILEHMTEGGMPSKVELDIDEEGALS